MYGSKFQRGVLFWMLKDYLFCSKCVLFLKPDYFTAELKWFLKTIIDHFKVTEAVIKHEDLANQILKHGDKSPAYEKELHDILKSELSFEYVRKELTGFVRANLFISGYKEASVLFNAGNTDDAYLVTQKKIDELLKVTFDESKIVQFGDHETICDIASMQKEEAIPTGIFAIDEALGGGLAPQTWTTFIGGSNVGKSLLCPNLAYFAMQQKKKTLVTIHEDEEVPTKIRYLSRFSGVPMHILIQNRKHWSPLVRELISKADSYLKNYVRFRFMYGTECFIEKVLEVVRGQKRDWDFDLFLCDYGQCLKSKNYKALEDRYGLHEYIYYELKQVCLELNIAGAGGAQSNRTGHKIARKGFDLLRAHDVGDSWGIVKKASNVITMNRSTDQMENNRVVFLLDKARNGRCPIAVECITDFSKAITHLPVSETEKTQNEIPIIESESKKNE